MQHGWLERGIYKAAFSLDYHRCFSRHYPLAVQCLIEVDSTHTCLRTVILRVLRGHMACALSSACFRARWLSILGPPTHWSSPPGRGSLSTNPPLWPSTKTPVRWKR